MKKTLRNFGLVITAILMAVSFAACSDDDDKDNNSDIVGTWKYQSEESDFFQVNSVWNFGSDGSFTTGVKVSGGSNISNSAKGSYKTNGDKLTIHIAWDEECGYDYPYDLYFKYKIEGNQLSLLMYEIESDGNIEYDTHWLQLVRQ